MKKKNIQRRSTTKQQGSQGQRKTGWLNRELSILIAFLLILGYVDLGAFTVARIGFRFTVRGPMFWRLSSGLPPYLHDLPKGPGGQAYLKLMALIAYLLLSDQAIIDSGSVVASGIVLTVSSPLFEWEKIKQVLSEHENSLLQRIVQFLITMVIGIGMMDSHQLFTITSVRFDPSFYIMFNVSSVALQRRRRILPSLLTIPLNIKSLRNLNRILGVLMILQFMRVIYLTIGRGGELGLGITGDFLAMNINGGKVP